MYLDDSKSGLEVPFFDRLRGFICEALFAFFFCEVWELVAGGATLLPVAGVVFRFAFPRLFGSNVSSAAFPPWEAQFGPPPPSARFFLRNTVDHCSLAATVIDRRTHFLSNHLTVATIYLP
jgi:hypothetical protein